MPLEIGLQLFSVRNSFIQDPQGTLKRIADIGYRNIEIPIDFSGQDRFGTGAIKAKNLRKMMEQVGLNIVATHVLFSEDSQFERVITYNKELGCKKIVIPIAFFKDVQAVVTFSQKLNEYGRQLQEHGMKLYYHNHFHEFQRFNGKYVMDIIIENTLDDLVGIELDTYWALRGGIDVPSYLEKLGKRCGLIHQKDLPRSVTPTNIFEFVAENEEITRENRPESIRQAQNFAEIGEGVMDIQAIIYAVEQWTEAHYIIVEQDATLREEMESIEISYKGLSMLLENVLSEI